MFGGICGTYLWALTRTKSVHSGLLRKGIFTHTELMGEEGVRIQQVKVLEGTFFEQKKLILVTS